MFLFFLKYSFFIRKLAKPFVQNGKSQTIALGSMLEVPCDGWGFPVSAVTWYGDDQLIIPDGNRIMFEDYHVNTELNLTGGLLKIKNVQYSDYKVYKCKLDNSFGNSNGTTLVRIKGISFIFFCVTRNTGCLPYSSQAFCKVTWVGSEK